MAATRVQTDPRISRRRAAVQRSKRRRLLLSLAALVVLAALIWTMFFSPVLQVREVRVKGAERTGAAAVSAATELIGRQQNLLLLSSAEIQRRVGALPWVRDVKVQRSLPGIVKVEVIEREPALVLSLGAARWTVDERGNVLSAGEAAPGLPRLAGVEVATVRAGVQLQTEEAIAALQVYRALPDSLRAELAALFAPSEERITLSLADGTSVRFGASERLPAKVKVLRSLLVRLAGEGRKAAYIDVRVPTSPAISPVQGAEVTAEGVSSPTPSP